MKKFKKLNAVPSVCKQCGRNKTIKAHIIPRAFALHAKGFAQTLLSIDKKGGQRLSQSGYWDRDILCATCDGKLGKYDAFFVSLCRRLAKLQTPQEGPCVLKNLDTAMVAKFANAVVWRASISKKPEFLEIDLKSKESVVAEGIFGEDPTSLLPVTVYRYTSKKFDPLGFYTHPYVHEIGDSTVITFSIGGFRIQTLVAGGPIPQNLSQHVMKHPSELRTAVLQLEKTSEFEGMLDMVRANRRREIQEA
jgi:hypothetical protein